MIFAIMNNKPSIHNNFRYRNVIGIAIFLFFLCTFSYKLYHNIIKQEIAKPVSVKISAPNAKQIRKIKVFRISPEFRIYELEKTTNGGTTTWLSKGRFFRKIWLGFPEELKENIKSVTIIIDKNRFSFSKQQIDKQWQKIKKADRRVAALLRDNWMILEVPSSVTNKRSSVPFLKNMINWPGDIEVLVDTLSFTFMFVLSMIFAVALLTIVFKRVTNFSNFGSNVPIRIIYVFVFLFIIFYFSPMLKSQFYFDDLVYNSITKGFYEVNGNPSLFSSIIGDIKSELTTGRFLVLSTVIHDTTFYLVDNAAVYKAYILLLVSINIILFVVFLKKLNKDNVNLLMLLFMLPVFFQFRANYHDPILGYNGLLEYLFSFLLISLILLLHYLENERKIFLALSIILYFFSLMTYEIAFPMVAIHLFLLYDRYGFVKKTLKISLLFLFPALLIFGYLIYLYLFVVNPETQYSGLKIVLNPIAVIKTYVIQLFSTVPLSYSIFSVRGPSLMDMIHNFSYLHFFIISLLFIIIIIALTPKLNDTLLRYDKRLMIIGLLLFMLPALPVAISFKYQHHLRFGIGYLPVYLQSYGLLLILANIFYLFKHRFHRSSNPLGKGYPLIFAIVYLIVALNSLSNVASIVQGNKSSYPTKILRLALDNNILGETNDETILLLEDKYLYNMQQYQLLFYEYLGRYISVYTVDEYLNKMKAGGVSGPINLLDKKVYILKSPPADLEDAYLSVGKISSIVFNEAENSDILVSQCKYFASNKHLYQRVSFETRSSNTFKTVDNVLKTPNQPYFLYSVSFKDKPAYFDSLKFY